MEPSVFKAKGRDLALGAEITRHQLGRVAGLQAEVIGSSILTLYGSEMKFWAAGDSGQIGAKSTKSAKRIAFIAPIQAPLRARVKGGGRGVERKSVLERFAVLVGKTAQFVSFFAIPDHFPVSVLNVGHGALLTIRFPANG